MSDTYNALSRENAQNTENSWIDRLELRQLKSTDLAPTCRIISAIGINEFKSCFESDAIKAMISGISEKRGKVNAGAVGIEVMINIAGVIISNIPKADTEIQKFVASVSGMTINEVRDLTLADYGELIIKIIKKEDYRDFFSRVVRLFK